MTHSSDQPAIRHTQGFAGAASGDFLEQAPGIANNFQRHAKPVTHSLRAG